MSSKGNSTGSNGQLPIGFGHLLTIRPLLGHEEVQLCHEVDGTSMETLACAATAVARVQGEIDVLWRDAVRVDDDLLSGRLVEVSRALQRAARLLEQERAIG